MAEEENTLSVFAYLNESYFFNILKIKGKGSINGF